MRGSYVQGMKYHRLLFLAFPLFTGSAEVSPITFDPITVDITNVKQIPTSCGQNNGAVTDILTDATDFRWFVEADPQVTISTDRNLINASPNFYMLELSNNSGSDTTIGPFHVTQGSPAIELSAQPVIQADACGLQTGSIRGLRVSSPVRSYVWRNSSAQIVGTTADITGMPAGQYSLRVENDDCSRDFQFTIPAQSRPIAAPTVDDILMCAPGNVLIRITALTQFVDAPPVYRLYNAAGTLIRESAQPAFRVSIERAGDYYAAVATGSCESQRTAFNISFGALGLGIPTAFSPNNDGTNDVWQIKGIEQYDRPQVVVYNRNGNIVFESRDPLKAFDGRRNGKDLPVGVYFYRIVIAGNCPPATGSLTIVR